MRVRNNTSARAGLCARNGTIQSMKKNLEKLSSGLRINRASDDAAGLSVSEKMRANITEEARCQNNVLEGLDLVRTADGALSEINDMLCRAKQLCLAAENGTYDAQERASISDELNELFNEIDRITANSRHNTIPLFRDTGEKTVVFDEGRRDSAGLSQPGTTTYTAQSGKTPPRNPPAAPTMTAPSAK